jgi:PIN domain nuclease of toxin-antitoxin system
MRLLLDACVLLWTAGEPTRFSAKVLEMLTAPSAERYVSAISAFEIAVKYRKGKLELPLSPREWFREVLATYGIQELPITSEIAVLSQEVAVSHSDPCDRFIIATAQTHGMVVVTPDTLIQDCKDIQAVW